MNGVCFPPIQTTLKPQTSNPKTTLKPLTSVKKTQSSGVKDGVAGHRNIGLINSKKCGEYNPLKARILNGNDAGFLEFPWAVLVMIREVKYKGNEYICGGSLINNRYVLTAAHCTTGFESPVNLTVRIGEYDWSKYVDCATIQGKMWCADPSQEVSVEKVLRFPGYKNATAEGNDIALLRLKQSVSMSDSVKTICLPVGTKEETRTFDGEMLTVTGWGLTYKGQISQVLQSVTVPGVSTSNCNRLFSNSDVTILPGQLCAGGRNNQDSCEGDSGGGLMHRGLSSDAMVQYGLVSYGADCGTTDLPGVYTRVGYYMNWILDNIYE